VDNVLWDQPQGAYLGLLLLLVHFLLLLLSQGVAAELLQAVAAAAQDLLQLQVAAVASQAGPPAQLRVHQLQLLMVLVLPLLVMLLVVPFLLQVVAPHKPEEQDQDQQQAEHLGKVAHPTLALLLLEVAHGQLLEPLLLLRACPYPL
jgi:hypothetical protein